MSRISTECEKLSLIKSGGTVEKEDIKEFVSAETDYKLYELSDAVAAKKNAEAASILKGLLQTKTAPATLLSMLYSHFRRLLFCLINKGEENLASFLAVKPYAVVRASTQSAKYSALRLKQICDMLSAADYNFKSGLISDSLALECSIFEILAS